MGSRMQSFTFILLVLALAVGNIFEVQGVSNPLDCNVIALKSGRDKWVSVEADGGANANSTSVGPNETWEVVSKGKHEVALKGSNDRYLVAEWAILPIFTGGVNANRAHAKTWETFQVFRSGDQVIFRTVHRSWLCANSKGELEHSGWNLSTGLIFEVKCLD